MDIYLSENLAFLRKLKKLRQHQLAAMVGVQPNTISNYEKGISAPDLVVLGKIRDALEVSLDDLVYMPSVRFQQVCRITGEEQESGAVEIRSDKVAAMSMVIKKLSEVQKLLDTELAPSLFRETPEHTSIYFKD